MSFLQNQPLSAHPTPCKQPAALEWALEALAQPGHLPPGHPWSNHPPHLPPLTPLLASFTHYPPPHLCREVDLLYILLIFVSNPSVNRFLHCRVCVAEYIFTSHEAILKALPLFSPNHSPTKSQLYILHKHTTSTPPPLPGRQAAETRNNNIRKVGHLLSENMEYKTQPLRAG